MISFVALFSISQITNGVEDLFICLWNAFPFFCPCIHWGGRLTFTVLICQSSSHISTRPSCSESKEFACSMVWSLGREDPLEKGMATQYFCLENAMDRGAWRVQSVGMHRVGHIGNVRIFCQLGLVFLLMFSLTRLHTSGLFFFTCLVLVFLSGPARSLFYILSLVNRPRNELVIYKCH